MKKWYRMIILAAAAVLLAFGCSTAVLAGTIDFSFEMTYGQTEARTMLAMINDFRTGSDAKAKDKNENWVAYDGLNELIYDTELEQVAMKRAAEVAILFSHTRPNGSSCASAGGWNTSTNVYGTTYGENIAAGRSTAEATYIQWREDDEDYSGQGHRRNMLNSNFTRVGIGHVYFNGYHYWVQEFGNASHSGTSAAKDETVVETISVEESYINNSSISFRNSVSSVKVPWKSTNQTIPEVKTAIRLQIPDDQYSYTWPSTAPVIADLTWTSGDTTILTVDGVTLTGKKVGTTTLSTSFRGKTLSVDAEVTPLPINGGTFTATAPDSVYDGNEKKPSVTVTDGTNLLQAGTDYSVVYTNNINAGTASFTVTAKGNYTGSLSGRFTIEPRTIKGAWVSSPGAHTYTGSAIEPAVTVKDDNHTLAAGTDYTVTYENNINVGAAKLTVIGKGNYKEETSPTTFAIQAKPLSEVSFSSIADQTYSGKALKPALTLKNGSAALKAGTDYTASYEKNINVGTAEVKVAGQGNYSGTVSRTFTIKAKSLSGCTLEGISDRTYNGKAQTQSVAVKDGSTVLTEGTDYTVSYEKNMNAGTAAVTAAGQGNYTGTVSGTFTIKAKSLSGCTLEGISDKTYNGKAQTQSVAVKDGSTVLTEGTDYTISYKDNTNAGTAAVTAVGRGNYTGTVSGNFAIKAKSLSGCKLAEISDQTYSGKKLTPALTLKDGSTVLKAGTDYTASYEKNINVGTAAVTAAGQGNYTGTVSGTFTIKAKSLSGCTLEGISDRTYSGKAQSQKITVKDGDVVLGEDTDYTISYENNINAGTATVTAAGQGNYTGTVSGTFTIKAKSLSGCTLEGISDRTYSGKAQSQKITVKDGDAVLGENTDYTISYENNINAGTATVTAAGKGNYRGKLEGTFTIKAKSLAGCTLEGLSDKTYSGKAQKPAISVKDGSTVLAEGTDYTVSCKNNKNAGTGTVTAAGKGNYRGKLEGTFTIKPKKITPDIELSETSYVYDGKVKTPEVTAKDGGTVLPEDSCEVSFAEGRKNAGTYSVTVTLSGNYTGSGSAEFTITKAAQPMKIKTKAVTLKYKTLKKKKQTIAVTEAATIKKAQGKLAYAKKSGSKKITVNKKTGAITVAKKTPKGTYKLQMKVTAKGTKNYSKGSKVITIKITVK